MHVVDTSKENQLIWADSIRSSEYYLKYKENVARGKEEYIGLLIILVLKVLSNWSDTRWFKTSVSRTSRL